MGHGYEFKCECGYSFSPFLGVGFLFPKEYKNLKDSALNGKLILHQFICHILHLLEQWRHVATIQIIEIPASNQSYHIRSNEDT